MSHASVIEFAFTDFPSYSFARNMVVGSAGLRVPLEFNLHHELIEVLCPRVVISLFASTLRTRCYLRL